MSWQVMIVDDEVEIREGLAAILNARGYKAFAASNGNEALEEIRRRGVQPALVLLDLKMPVLDGIGFLEAQAEDPWLCEVPVVIITAHTPPAIDFKSVRAVMPKPLDLPKLLAILRQACHATPPLRRTQQ